MMWISTFYGLFLWNLIAATAISVDLDTNTQQIPDTRLKLDNCIVGNVTYKHDETFKLDCKTQCVCENGRHACSSLCPKEMLTPPEDTRLCRSPKLVEMSGHCCKVWQCDKPSEDVSRTCHNSTAGPWTECTESCGIGLSTRSTYASIGCQPPSSLRLCQNRQCAMRRQQSSTTASGDGNRFNLNALPQQDDVHKVRKGHECRNLQRLASSRIRLGPCVSRHLYRPKICGQCQSRNKCCVPLVSTTIQVEMLCPLSARDPLEFIEPTADLWDTTATDPIDQEYMRTHRIPMENRFVDVQWVLKCECTRRGKSCVEIAGQRAPSITRDEVIDDRQRQQHRLIRNDNSDTTATPTYDADGDADQRRPNLAAISTSSINMDEDTDGDDDDGQLDLQELLKRVHRT